MEFITQYYYIEPFFHEVLKYLDIKDFFFSIKPINQETNDLSYFIFLFSHLKKENKLTISSKSELMKVFNKKYSNIIFFEPIQITNENKFKYYSSLKDVFKFHTRLLIPNCIDIIKANDTSFHSFISTENNQCQIKNILGSTKKIELLDSLELEPIFVSSTDESSQNIWKPLLCDTEFWSSKGSLTSDGNEYMIFRAANIISLFTGFSIKNFKATFHYNNPIYGPKKVKISIGFKRDNYHFISEEISLNNSDEPQSFFFLPYYIIGSYIRIDLIGKYQIQEIDYQYYHAIQKINVYGKPLYYFNSKSLNSLIHNYLDNNNMLNYEYICCLLNKEIANTSKYYDILENQLNTLLSSILKEEVIKNDQLFINSSKNLSAFINDNSLFMLYHPKLIEIIKSISKYKLFLGIHKRVNSHNESIVMKKLSDFDFLLFNYATGSKFGLDGSSNFFQLYDSVFTESVIKILNSIKPPSVNSRLKYILCDGLIESFDSVEDFNMIIKIMLKKEFKLTNSTCKRINKSNLCLLLNMIYNQLETTPKVFIKEFVKQIYIKERNIYSCLSFYMTLLRTIVKNDNFSSELTELVSDLIINKEEH